jgi:hypothetical protein
MMFGRSVLAISIVLLISSLALLWISTDFFAVIAGTVAYLFLLPLLTLPLLTALHFVPAREEQPHDRNTDTAKGNWQNGRTEEHQELKRPLVDMSGQVAAENRRRLQSDEEDLAHKRQELAALESELAETELHAAGIRISLAAFERRYLQMVGTRYAELDEIEAQLAEIVARNRPSDRDAQDSAEQARKRADDSQAAAHEQSPGAPKEFAPSPSLKALYRRVAKRIHPDLTSDPAERLSRQELMANVTNVTNVEKRW